jgi:hypothetical protein
MVKVFRVKRGKISFREKIEVTSFYQELRWKFEMMLKGCRVREIKGDRGTVS